MNNERETLIFSALEPLLQNPWIRLHITRCELEVLPNGRARFIRRFDSWLSTENKINWIPL